jgi:hypothetical protein
MATPAPRATRLRGLRLAGLLALALEGEAPAFGREPDWNDATTAPSDIAGPRAPDFADYAVAPAFSRIPRPVDLASHRDAWRWRSRLREGAAAGPNFADHFTLITWGCGADCTQLAIVCAWTGEVFFPRELAVLYAASNIHDEVVDRGTLLFRRDSRLLVAVGMPNEDPLVRGVSYYEWTGNALKPLLRARRNWYK